MMRTKEFMVVATFVLIYTFYNLTVANPLWSYGTPRDQISIVPVHSCANFTSKNFGYISTHFFGINSKRNTIFIYIHWTIPQ